MKIALDTNVLIRIIACDDELRVNKAHSLIESYDSREIFISYGALIEAFYVLTKKYKFSKESVLSSFDKLLRVPQFCFEHETLVHLTISKSLKGYTFNDALIGEIGASRNLKTYTFDKGLKDNKNYEVI